MRTALLTSAAVLALAACTAPTDLPEHAGYGPTPQLPAPKKQTIPVVDIAPAVGWPGNLTPAAAPGLNVAAFAKGLDHPRWIYVLPNGDVLEYAIADFVTASGERIEGHGVVPDEPVRRTLDSIAAGEDSVLEAAVRWAGGGAE